MHGFTWIDSDRKFISLNDGRNRNSSEKLGVRLSLSNEIEL
jgi:hypothetical protein